MQGTLLSMKSRNGVLRTNSQEAVGVLEEEEEEEDFCLSASLLSAWCELSLRSSGRSRLGLKLGIGSVVEICELVRNHLCFQLIQLIEVVPLMVIFERTRLCP